MSRDEPASTHYSVLQIAVNDPMFPPNVSPLVVKQAYHKALLKCHPDKAHPEDAPISLTTVDRLRLAYEVLTNTILKAHYDQGLAMRYKTPVRVVDLDDMTMQTSTVDGHEAIWTLPCRCGNDQLGGFFVTTSELEQGVNTIECGTCSEVIHLDYEEIAV